MAGGLWIQVDTGIREHDKIYNLADTLKITDAHAVGLMVCLWTWAVTSAPDGDITDFPQRAIAKAAGWDKQAKTFFDAICSKESRFVEEVDGRLKFRNWEERAELLMDALESRKKKTNERVRRYRERKLKNGNAESNADIEDTDHDKNSDVTQGNADVTRYGNGDVTNGVTHGNGGETKNVTLVTPLPNLTVPDLTIPNRNGETLSPPKAAEDGAENAQQSRFDAFWSAYPKKVGKEAARKAWGKIKPKPSEEMLAKMLTAIAQAKLTDQWKREGMRYVPNPATWLNQGRWDDEVPQGGTMTKGCADVAGTWGGAV